jgi:small-conductance mechanosensitive channel/CRP-like cAMP-binding protein
MATNDLLFWVVLLSVSFPLLVVMLTELRSRMTNDVAVQLIRITINSTAPLVAIWVLVEKVFGLPRTDTISRIIQTLCWVSLLNMALLLINTLIVLRHENRVRQQEAEKKLQQTRRSTRKDGSRKDGSSAWQGLQSGFGAAHGSAQSPTSTKVSQAPSKVMLDFVRFVVVLIGTGIVLALVWDVDLRGVITTLGVGSIIIGFALQDTLGSLVAGFLTLVRRPFVVGDKVMIGDTEGEVREITWNSVVLRRPDKALAIFPQSDIAKRPIVNLSRLTGTEHTEVFVEFSKQHPPNNVKRVVMSALWATPGVAQDPEPLVRTTDHTDVNIRYSVRFWTPLGTSPLETRDHFLSRLWYVAKRYDLKCELPTRKFVQTVETPHAEHLLSQFREEISSTPFLFKMGGANATSMNNDVLEYLAKGARLLQYAAGEYIVREGEMVDSLYIVLQGEARSVMSARDGRQQQVFVVRQGEFFGENSLFSGRPSPFSVIALKDLVVIALGKEMVNRIVENDAMIVKEIGRVISDRRARRLELEASDK